MISYHYDDVMDMLFILFEARPSWSAYEEIDELPGAMRRYDAEDRFVGISVDGVTRHFTDDTSPENMERLATMLIERFAPSPSSS